MKNRRPSIALMIGLVLLAAPLLLNCDPETPDVCLSDEGAEVLVGQGVGGAFVELAEEASVMLFAAPQGGFGVPVVLQTRNLAAGDDVFAAVKLEAIRGGVVEGTFETNARVLCRSDGNGGNLSGIVVGLDPAIYPTNDDLLGLDGELLDLQITVTDEDGREAVAVKTVTIQVGG